MKLTEIFLNTEITYDLNNKDINDYKYWSYNRGYIYSYLYTKEQGHKAAHETLNIRNQLVRYFKNSVTCFKLMNKRKRALKNLNKHKVLLVRCHPRRTLIDDKMVSIYSDLVLEDKKNVITYEPTDLFSHYQPCSSRNIEYLDFVELKSRCKYVIDRLLFKAKYKRLFDLYMHELEGVLTELEEQTHIKIDKSEIIKIIVKHYYYVIEMKKFWERELKKYNIAAVIQVVGYSLDNKALSEIAHKNGIPVIELQHGTINENHLGYNYYDHDRICLTPDYILTFGDIWSKQISIPDTKVVSTGFEYYLRERDKYLLKKERKNQILFISQRNVGGYLSELALKISDYIENNNLNYNIVYKLHPGEYEGAKDLYPGLYNRRNIVVKKSEDHLYELFATSKIQIGYNSTALFEGMGFGLKTFFTDCEDNLMKSLIDLKMAELISLEGDMQSVFNGVSDGDFDLNADVIDLLWKQNAKSNVNRIIKEIIRNE